MRAWVKNLIKIKDTPEAMARGLAVGFFFGVSLLWGLQIALAVLVSYPLRGNKVVAAAMTAVSNPLTSLPLYSLCYLVGHLVLGGQDAVPDFSSMLGGQQFWTLGPHFFFTMFIGTTLVGLVGALAIYLFAHHLLAALHRLHAGKHAENLPHQSDEKSL